MQGRMVQLERAVAERENTENILFLDKRHLLYRRMERWVRLQQFVYGLSDDFSYSVFASEQSGIATCRVLVRVGEMSWYGEGKAADPEQALALALIATSDAISANAYKVFFYSAAKWFHGFRKNMKRRPPVAGERIRQRELLAS